MNKVELARKIQEKSQYDISQNMAEDMVNAFMETIKEEVAAGNSVQLIGFGTFSLGHRAERKGKNPRTGEEMTIAAKNVPKFNPGQAFRTMVL